MTNIRVYFQRKCNSQVGGKNFYKTVKPFLCTKSSDISSKIVLREDDNIISNPSKVAEIFNLYYASIAEYKSQPDGLNECNIHDLISKHAGHKSIHLINQHKSVTTRFDFDLVSVDTVLTYMNKLQTNKASGFDGLSAKFIKLSSPIIAETLCKLFNACVSS